MQMSILLLVMAVVIGLANIPSGPVCSNGAIFPDSDHKIIPDRITFLHDNVRSVNVHTDQR